MNSYRKNCLFLSPYKLQPLEIVKHSAQGFSPYANYLRNPFVG
jgi:hypothetical protein